MRKIVGVIFLILVGIASSAQEPKSRDSLENELSETKAAIKALEAKVADIQDTIDELPGWNLGALGTLGINFSHFNNWYSNTNPNLLEGHVSIVQNGYAKLNRESYFWVNHANLHLSWKLSYNKDKDLESKGFELKTDIFRLSSLFGYKLSEEFAVCALTDYRGSFIKNISAPSFWDLGIGASWKPVNNLYLVVNPLNYEFIFSNKEKHDYKSSSGTKLLADYTHKIGKVNFKTNLVAFISYRSFLYSNWTSTNSFTYILWKKVGLGLNFGLSQNRQEVFNSALNNCPTLEDTNNKLQSFWTFGVSYSM
ncbi:MAG: hypothetical protein CSA95_01350 [Bacteroidetes bacterium]|nr:MAG: hypothetical protein CSA95_01350 [Bacteroidota bacterium]PIE88203.1 MAG: hypothetical protein CSA04_03145 [Bacteroidota bacterium]